ncbi:MAG: M28 family peptidase, partial [Spirochaetales bacterium]|nr:M28 family peptidase [Spirochaetales bacterium]
MKHGTGNRIPRVSLAILLTTFTAASCGDQGKTIIRGTELKDHVTFLASDTLNGRYLGTDGINAAEEYIAGWFADMGLSPLPEEENYFLEFELESWSFDEDLTFIKTSNGTQQAIPGLDFRPFQFSDFGEVTGKVIFAGYGITAPEYSYDDYKDLDATGKIVLIMRHEPDESSNGDRFEGSTHSKHAEFKTKAENAKSHGATGMLLFTDPLHHAKSEDFRIRPAYYFPGGADAGTTPEIAEKPFIAFHISQQTAGLLLRGSDLSSLQKAVDSGTQAADNAIVYDNMVTLSYFPETAPTLVPVRNVAAYIPGTNPELADHWLLVGAHHDHIGSFVQEPGETYDTIFNGADDNASGVAGVLELAQQFAAAPAQRPIAFITFSAEEEGLFGSRALKSLSLIDISQIDFALNLDMIGRNPDNPIMIYGDGFAEGLGDIAEEHATANDTRITLMGKRYQPFSDFVIFHDSKIPYLMLFTGEHEDYHGTGDHSDR